jgi:serine/threonine protein kinase
VLHQIGAGTLGPVFRAYEPDRDRLVAIKLFRLDLPPERVHQLVGEFEQMIEAGLDHPVIAAPVATGIEGVTAYLAQEYVTADSLDVAIREGGPASVPDALGVAARLAEALDYAADRRVVHGGLHPRDVLRSPEDFRVTGLGVTRALERVGVVAPVRRPYTAPERVGGGAWDRRADVFGLAAVMHELIWGRRLAGTGAQAASSISDAAGGDLSAVRDVFARALADDMADRFPTATEFSNALAGVLEGRPPKVSRMVRRAPRLVVEPRLPLETDRPADPALFTPESSRYREIQMNEPVRHDAPLERDARPAEPAEPVELVEPAELREPAEPRELVEPLDSPDLVERVVAGSLLSPAPAEGTSSLSLVWPLVLAGLVGVALGFGAGYAVAIRDRPVAVASVVPNTPTAVPAVPAPHPAGGLVARELPAPAESPEPVGSAVVPPPAPVAPPSVRTTAPREAAPVAPLFAGRVLVRSTPPGARVFVDGHGGGETPTTVRDLARGTHQVRLVREGYTTVERRIAITASQPSQTLTVAMVKTPPAAPVKTEAPLVVESKPSGAVVLLDGRQVGTTPLTFPLVPVGSHSIRITLEGYRPWTSAVQVNATETNRVTASLER